MHTAAQKAESLNTETTKASDLFVQALEAEGVEHIFAVPGEENLDMVESLRTSKIKLVLTRHEQGASHAAQGYARISGRVGVAIATSGPGATNFITGIADAMIDSTPMVCITGQVPDHLLGSDAFQRWNKDVLERLGKHGAQGFLNGL